MPRSTSSRPSLLAPIRIKSPRIEQFRDTVPLPNGTFALAEQPEIRAEPAEMTGSRFPDPGYDITMKSIDITRYTRPLPNPITGKEVNDPNDPGGGRRSGLAYRFAPEHLLGRVRSPSSTGRASTPTSTTSSLLFA